MIRQRGFTLLEISIAMTIMAAMAAIATRTVYLKLDTRYTEHTAAEVWVIGEYAQKYIQDNGEWPDETNGCVGAIPTVESALSLPSGTIPSQSPWGTPYVTSCVADTNFSVEVQLDDNWAPAMTNMLAVTQIKGGTTDTTITTLPLPGSIAALSNVLKRTADPMHPEYNRMETDLDMDGNDIDNAGTINADSIRSDYITSMWGIKTHSTIEAGSPPSSSDTSFFAIETYGGEVDGEYGGTIGEPRYPAQPNGSIKMNDAYLNSIGGWLSTRLPNMVEKQSFVAYGGDLIPKPECLDGTVPSSGVFVGATPKIKIHPAEGSYAIDYDDQYWEVVSSNSDELLHADIYCYYPPLNDTLPDMVSLGSDLNDLRASGNLVVNDLTNALTVLIGYNVTDGIGMTVNTNHARNNWLTPFYATYSSCMPRIMDPCQGTGYIYERPSQPIVSVNNTSDRWLSFDVSMSIYSAGGDPTKIGIFAFGGEVYSSPEWTSQGTMSFSHSIVVAPGEQTDILLKGWWGSGRGSELARVTSFNVDTAIHVSDPTP